PGLHRPTTGRHRFSAQYDVAIMTPESAAREWTRLCYRAERESNAGQDHSVQSSDAAAAAADGKILFSGGQFGSNIISSSTASTSKSTSWKAFWLSSMLAPGTAYHLYLIHPFCVLD